MKTAVCDCGHSFLYVTIFTKIKCRKCGEMVEVAPSTIEELNTEPEETDEVEG